MLLRLLLSVGGGVLLRISLLLSLFDVGEEKRNEGERKGGEEKKKGKRRRREEGRTKEKRRGENEGEEGEQRTEKGGTKEGRERRREQKLRERKRGGNNKGGRGCFRVWEFKYNFFNYFPTENSVVIFRRTIIPSEIVYSDGKFRRKL